MSNLAYGTFTITNLSVVTSVDVYYYNSTSSTSLVGGSWSTNTPTWSNGKYIWSKTITTWEQGVTTQSQPVCITGQKGSTGSTGQSVTKITQQYALSTSNQTAPTTGWSTTMPTFQTGKYYWTRSEIVWANPTNTTYTTAVLANGITSANTTAATANQTATAANQAAQNAVSIANGKNAIYYQNSKPTGGTYKSGDTWFFLTDDGYRIYEYDTTANDWVPKNMDGKAITAGTITAAEIQAGAITTNKLASNAIQSSNYTAGAAPYSTAGTFLDLTQGNIYTPNFGVNNTAILENNQIKLNVGAYIKGSIYAYDGTIGSNIGSTGNYWYIGNYLDYNQDTSALIKGYGTATIQLGNTYTFRLNTDRIHTSWYDANSNDALLLHYPFYNNKYWDMGLHVPTSSSDKFIYIRKSKSNELENLQNSINDNVNGTNNYWNYQFYVTNEGNLYARNLYVIDDNGAVTPIGGADGVYLLKSGGIITGTLTINSTLQVKGNYLNKDGNALTLQTNLGSTTAGTLTGNTSSAISIGVTGTLPSTSGGTGNVNWNQGGVVYIDGSSPKKLLSTAAGTSGYLLQSNGTGAPTWINPATLTVAAATKATQDGDGNVIKTTYLKLSGGNVTGPVSFGDSVSVDDLNAGTLVVTGNASFVNNVNVDSINGVQVGETPKFTDTVTTITTSGNGNAITAITASNGVLTATKGSTFLTGITSSQVTTALGYTPYNATNPNGYTNNTGTVKKVRVQASSPLQSSTSTEQSVSLDTTISFVNQNTNVVLAGPSSGSAAAPAFRALVAADIPTLTKSKISDFPTVWALSSVTGADDLKAIEALEGTSGLLKKTGANTWTLDTSAYVTSSGVTSITLTQGTGISIGSSGTAITSTGTRTISLADNYGDTKNPYASKTARYVLAAPAAANGVPSFRALTKADVGLNNVLNYGQVTAIGQGDNGTLRVWTGDPTSTSTDDYEDIAITITAYNQSTVSKAGALNLSAAVGSTSKPVYFKADGKPYEISYTIEKSVPSNAVFTDTWNKVSTAQDGYVTKLPGNTTTFLRGDGTWGTPGGTYSLPLAASGTRGGVQIGYSTSGKNYAVQLSSQKMYVNVPWTDTTYSAGTGLSLSGTTFSNSGVTGIKGNNEGSYRTGQVNLTAANINAVDKNAELQTTNPFAPNSLKGPYISKIDNAFYAADKQWTITATNTTSAVSLLFDGSYDSQFRIEDGKTCVITFDFSNTTYFPGYPYGYILISFYYAAKPTSISGRVYCNYASQGIGWHDISFSPLSDNTSVSTVYRSEHQGYYSISQLEITIVGDTTNSYGYTGVTQIEMHLDRPNSNRNPFLSKYAAETLYYDLTAPKFIGSLQGNASTATNVAWSGITSKPTTLSGYGITDSVLKWQTSTTAATNVYDFGVYVAQGTGGATGPANGNYYAMLNIPYRKAFGNTKADYGWSIAGSTSNDKRLFYRTSDGNTWGDWVEIAHINAGTAVGNATQPVYVSSTGVVTACTSYANASVNHAMSANSATKATQDSDGNQINTTYLKLAGGTMTGPLSWNSTSLPQFSGSPTYLVGIQGFANGGTMKWQNVSSITVGAATKATQDKNGNDITTKYITIDTEQTISGRKTFSNLAAATFKPNSGTESCNINYNTSLNALVFSFA